MRRVACVAVAFSLSACASSAVPARTGLPGFASQQAGAARPRGSSLLYVANYAKNTVDIFPAGVTRPRRSGTITQGVRAPVDVFVDASGTLYVANSKPRSVTEYPAGQTAPSVTVRLVAQPKYVTAGVDGTIYVASYNGSGKSDSVAEYDPGATKPSRIIRYKVDYVCGPADVGGVATDSANDLYVNVGYLCGSGGFGVLRYPPKSIQSNGEFSVNANYAGGLAIDQPSGEAFVGDPYDAALTEYDLNTNQAASFRTIYGDYVAYDAADQLLYLSSGQNGIAIYDAASGEFGRQVGLIPEGAVSHGGVAIGPAP